MGTKKLVIVESPAKAKTIAGYLGDDYRVEASIGHIRDLPRPSDLPEKLKKSDYGKFSVNINDNFKPYYVVSDDKVKQVKMLKAQLKDCDELYLATDEDREGEAIAWHLLEVLKPKVPVKRMVFHEITKDAIQNALKNTREVDNHLVEAQETRRILDRLVGYEVSPLLWRKVGRGLSAGRVQSVATRMVVERERERMSFVPAHYYDLNVKFQVDTLLAQQISTAGGGLVGETSPESILLEQTAEESAAPASFTARAISLDGQRFAQGRDFADDGQLKRKVLVIDQPLWQKLKDAVEQQKDAYVTQVESKPYRRRPVAPFTTSTLQQEAGRKLRMSSRQIMRLAQHLYENGYITYMRTDSTALSTQAVKAARAQALKLYGKEFVPERPRVYATKSKGAQEAHEAIRPAGNTFKTPQQVSNLVAEPEAALYELIWKRTLASQMTDALGRTDTVHLQMDLLLEGRSQQLQLSASGTVITHLGFMAAYQESQDKSRYGSKESSHRLPTLSEGEVLTCQQVESDNAEHTTTAPPRYTEASLVKTLEERGVGRPSTYAATIGVIIDRGYVIRRGQSLIPSWLAFSVVRLLEENLATLVDYDFTALMENQLDEIAAGEKDGRHWLKDFYFGRETAQASGDAISLEPGSGKETADQGESRGDSQHTHSFVQEGLQRSVANLDDIDARALNSIKITDDVELRVGRYGPYLEKISDQSRASIPAELAPDELSAEKVAELYEAAALDGRELGQDPETGHTVVVKSGRFGPYVTEILPEESSKTAENTSGSAKSGPKAKRKKSTARTASLFKQMNLESIDLDTALQLLNLPRIVGLDPDGVQVEAHNGRFGPYLKRGSDTRSLQDEEQIFSIDLPQALEVLAQPKSRRRSAVAPLAEFDLDPESGKKVVIKEGRFGPYITDGVTNVTVPRGSDPKEVTAAQAYQLLADKRAKGPAKKATSKKTTAKKKTATAKKSTTKKSTTKAANTKKTSTKKGSAAKKTATKETATK